MQRRRLLRLSMAAVLGLAPLAMGGCGNSDLPPLARVSGTVTRNGKPLPNVVVNFQPTEGRPSFGITDENGRYELEYNRNEMGAEVDHHKVFVVLNATTMSGGIEMEQLTQEDIQDIQSKYYVDTSKLEYDVTEDGQVIDLALD